MTISMTEGKIAEFKVGNRIGGRSEEEKVFRKKKWSKYMRIGNFYYLGRVCK